MTLDEFTNEDVRHLNPEHIIRVRKARRILEPELVLACTDFVGDKVVKLTDGFHSAHGHCAQSSPFALLKVLTAPQRAEKLGSIGFRDQRSRINPRLTMGEVYHAPAGSVNNV
jgi:hypothetical protein